MADVKSQFEQAQKDVKTLTSRPSNDQLLSLYALFKQGTEGDASGKRPGMMDIKGRAKFDAWAKLKGTDQEQAMQKYIALVKSLLAG